jgi:hypothetical protein
VVTPINNNGPNPSSGEQLGLMYKRWTLDCIVNIAYAVALDFSQRPELYQEVSDEIAEELTGLQSEFGFDSDFPNTSTRQMLMAPIFGESDGHSSGNDASAFQTFRLPVLAAAADFSENAQPTAFAMLRERVRSAVVPFRTHLIDLQGASINQTRKRTEFVFNVAQKILKDGKISLVFGINGLGDDDWPLKKIDPQRAKLIDKITTQLTGLPYGVITKEMFVRIQRIAEKGDQSIRIIVDQNIEDPKIDLDQLIAELYAWGSDLGLVGGTRPQMAARVQPAWPAMSATATTAKS